MYRLLTANISRLCSNMAFKITVIIMISLECIVGFLLLQQDTTRIDLMLFPIIQGMGILISIFLSLFMGTEYNDGTIRNKLIVGHERRDVYLSSFFTGVFAASFLYILWLIIGGIFAVLMQISLQITIQHFLAGFVGWLACISYVSIYNLIGMLSSNKAKTSILCIMISFALMFGGLLCYSLSRPGMLSGMKQMLFQVLFDIDPYGQIFQFMTVDMTSLWKLAIYSFFLIMFLTGLGLSVFNKKDVK